MISKKNKSRLKDVCFAIIMKQTNNSDDDSLDQAIHAHKKDIINLFATMSKENKDFEEIIREVYFKSDSPVVEFKNILHGKD